MNMKLRKKKKTIFDKNVSFSIFLFYKSIQDNKIHQSRLTFQTRHLPIPPGVVELPQSPPPPELVHHMDDDARIIKRIILASVKSSRYKNNLQQTRRENINFNFHCSLRQEWERGRDKRVFTRKEWISPALMSSHFKSTNDECRLSSVSFHFNK